MTTPFDPQGYPDIAGSRPLDGGQIQRASEVRLAVNKLLATHFERHPNMTDEQARLMSMARSYLEIAAVLAIKSISREGE